MPPSVLVGEDMSGRNKMRKWCCQHFKYIWVYQVFKWFSQIKIESYYDANFAIIAWWHHKLRKSWHDDNGFQCSNQWSVGVLLCLDSFARVAKGLYRERRYLRSLVELWTPSWDPFTVGFSWLSAPSRENELGEEIVTRDSNKDLMTWKRFLHYWPFVWESNIHKWILFTKAS